MVQLGYIAGFLDGEGSIAIGKGRTHYSGKRVFYLRLSVHQVDRRPLDALAERYGGSLRLSTSHKPNPIWEWVVSGTTAAKVLAEVEPLLISKREQAQLALEFQSRKSTHGNRATSGEELAAQEELYTRMRELKRVRAD